MFSLRLAQTTEVVKLIVIYPDLCRKARKSVSRTSGCIYCNVRPGRWVNEISLHWQKQKSSLGCCHICGWDSTACKADTAFCRLDDTADSHAILGL